MVKSLQPFIFLFALLLAMLFSKQVSVHSFSVLSTFCVKMLPSLAPCLLLDYLFINADGLYFLNNLLGKCKKLSSFRIYPLSIIILGILSGTPTLATYVHDSINKNLITPQEGQAILNSFSFPSLPFLLGIIFLPFSFSYRFYLLALLLISGTINFYLFAGPQTSTAPILRSQPPKNLVAKAILDTGKTLLLMLGTMLLFSLPLIGLSIFLNQGQTFVISGLFEFSYSLYHLNHETTLLLKTAFVFLLSFSSLSVFSQIKIMCPSINLKNVIKNRVVIAVINSSISFIFFYFSLF